MKKLVKTILVPKQEFEHKVLVRHISMDGTLEGNIKELQEYKKKYGDEGWADLRLETFVSHGWSDQIDIRIQLTGKRPVSVSATE